MGLDDLVDGSGQGFVHGPVQPLRLGLVVGRRPRLTEHPAETGYGVIHA